MPALATAYVNIRAKNKRLKSDLDKTKKMISKSVGIFQKTIDTLTFGHSKLAALGFAGAATYAFGKVAGSAIDVAASFESMEIKLNSLTRGKGRETLEKLNAWALDMPVNTREAVSAFTTMQAMGLEPTIQKMQTLIDVSSIFGEDALGRVSLALGQMSTLGRISAQDLNQLAQVGINARKILRDAFGMSVEELQRSGKSMNEIIAAIWKGLDANYSGAAKAAMKSWQGLTATFKSYLEEIARQLMEAGIFEELKKGISEINEHLKSWIRNNQDFIKQDLPKYVKTTAKALYDLAKGTAWVVEKVYKALEVMNRANAIPGISQAINSLKVYQSLKEMTAGPTYHKIDDTRVKDAEKELKRSAANIVTAKEKVVSINKAIEASYKNVTATIAKNEAGNMEDMWLTYTDGMEDAAKRAAEILEETGGLTLFDIDQGKEEANQIKDLWQSQLEGLKDAKERADQILLTETFGESLYDADITNQFYDDLIKLSDSTANAMQDSFSDLFFDTMRGEFKSLGEYADSFLKSLQRAIANFFAQKMVQSMFGESGQGGGIFANLFHSGGVVGSSTQQREVSPLMFAHAPRLHQGLLSDEFPAILQRGESVIPKNSTMAPPKVILNITNNSGQAVKTSNISEKWNGQEYVVDLMIDAHERNVNGLRDVFGR